MITIGGIINAIAARHLPLHMAVELSEPVLADLWLAERDTDRMIDLLDWIGTIVPITLVLEAAALAIDHVDRGAATDYLAAARLLLESQGLPRSRTSDLVRQFEAARIAASERLEIARIEALDAGHRAESFGDIDGDEEREAIATKSAWHAVVMAMRALGTQLRGVDARNQIGQSIGFASNVFASDAPTRIPDLIRRDFGPPTLDQIVAATSAQR